MTHNLYHWLLVLLAAAFLTACGAETTCKVCGQSIPPNIVIGYADLSEHPTDTLDAEITVEMRGTGRIMDLNDEEYQYKDSCPLRFPKRLNCQYGFRTLNTTPQDKTMIVRMKADGVSYEQEYSVAEFEASCPIGTGYIQIVRDDTGYHFADEIELVTECEENP